MTAQMLGLPRSEREARELELKGLVSRSGADPPDLDGFSDVELQGALNVARCHMVDAETPSRRRRRR